MLVRYLSLDHFLRRLATGICSVTAADDERSNCCIRRHADRKKRQNQANLYEAGGHM